MLDLHLFTCFIFLSIPSWTSALLANTPSTWLVFVRIPAWASALVAHRVVNFVRHGLAHSRRSVAWDTSNVDVDLWLRLSWEVTWGLLIAGLYEARWLLEAHRRLLITHWRLLEAWLLESWLGITHRRLLLITLRWEAAHLLRESLRSSHHWLLHHGLLHHRLLHHWLLHHRLLHHRLLHHWLLELWVLHWSLCWWSESAW